MDDGLAIDRRDADVVLPVSRQGATVAPRVVVPDLDLVLALEADAVIALAMRVDVSDEDAAAGARADLNRRATLFADLFDRWRESEGLEEGGTWHA